ncbi:4,5-DOPA dioxygenase extradiol [Enterovibrio norvegicus]|uniref:Aromatic ring-opening dioxygenase, catalytic subunit, LigB family n=1 Tax=Enterovibrio norvegicus DSM 15893 TaxID=1121869 RepID=A0A1I5KZ51_9GAMM|nr:4,5-DOPA dioxygenase extradiol [Enterovibrio norvegicus]SFO90315.1 Aromatic ring-opening dioxygenase, catalytic subunit, LigB family [Enterovibrio norvegicus DSM 15893]
MSLPTQASMGQRMPALFIGHGTPIYTLSENRYTNAWKQIARGMAVPKAILCISAHWMTRGTRITTADYPKTIYDFGPIDTRLNVIEYKAPGAPSLARDIAGRLPFDIELDEGWGIDHGAWTVLRHMYPDANVPVVQMSLDMNLSAREHFERGKALDFLRYENVLILASGNIVHNLTVIDPREDHAYPWALHADAKMAHHMVQNDIESLIDYSSLGEDIELAIPTPEHYWPLLYALGAKNDDDILSFPVMGISHGSNSMRSVLISPQ